MDDCESCPAKLNLGMFSQHNFHYRLYYISVVTKPDFYLSITLFKQVPESPSGLKKEPKFLI